MRERSFVLNGALFLISVSAILGFSFRAAGQSTSVDASTNQAQMELIRKAGDRLGVPVRNDHIARFTQGGESMFVAPAANLASVPAPTFSGGANIGAAYFDMPSQSIPKGFYKLKAIAKIKTVGKTVGRVQLIGETGRVAAEWPATFDVKSMTTVSNAASQPGNMAMCIGANCLGEVKHATLIKHVSLICTFDVEQNISCWLGPGGLSRLGHPS